MLCKVPRRFFLKGRLVRYQFTSPTSLSSESEKFAKICQQNNFSQALSLLKQTTSRPTRQEFYRHLIYYLGKAKKTRECTELIQSATREQSLNSSIGNVYIFALCHNNRVKEATAFFQKDRTFQTIDSYNVLINAHCQINQPEKAMEYVTKMNERGIPPTAYSITPLMNYYSKHDQLENVLELEELMNKIGISKTIVTYNVIIQARARRGQVDEIFQLFQEMNLSGINPVAETFSHVIQAFINSGRANEAAQYFEVYKRVHTPDLISYTMLIRVLGELELYPDMLKFFNDMKENNINPDKVLYQIVIGNLIKAMEQYSQLIIKLFKEMHDDEIIADMALYNMALKSLFLHKFDEIADELMDLIQNIGLSYDSYTYSIIIGRKLYLKHYQEALDIAQEAKQEDLLNQKTAMLLIDKLCRFGKLEKVLQASKKGIVRPNWKIVEFLLAAKKSPERKALKALEYVTENELPHDVGEYNNLFNIFNDWKADNAIKTLWKHVQPLGLSLSSQTNRILEEKGLLS